MGWGRRGGDGAATPDGPAPNTVPDSKNDQLVKGIAKIPQAERERLADVQAQAYDAFRRKGGSD